MLWGPRTFEEGRQCGGPPLRAASASAYTAAVVAFSVGIAAVSHD